MPKTKRNSVHVIDDPVTLQALAHPLRVRILDALNEAKSAASVARSVDVPRQKVNYHLKELERAGLVRRTGERRNGNFIETLYESCARTLLVSPRATWGDGRRADTMHEQLSLENLVELGERLGRDAITLLDRAAFDGDEIKSAAVEARVHLASPEQRADFMNEYLKAIGPVLRKFGRRRGPIYKVALAVYPDPDTNDEGVEQ